MLRHAAGADDDPELRKEARRLVHSGRQLIPCVCIPVLGELTLVLCRDRVGRDAISNAVDRIYRWVERGDMELYGLGDADVVVGEVAADIRLRDPRISPTDAGIVACMLEDPNADALYTTDRGLLENRTVAEMAQERGKKLHELGRSRDATRARFERSLIRRT